MATQKQKLHCSSCDKSRPDIASLIQVAGIILCNECLAQCVVLSQEGLVSDQGKPEENFRAPTPKEIREALDKFVVKQEQAKKVLAVSAYNHYKRLDLIKKGRLHPLNINDDTEVAKSNVLMIGPTGSGKTLLARRLAEILNVPFAVADATTLTEAGYVGDDVESILHKLLQAAHDNVEMAQVGVVYIDEIDKLSRRSDSLAVARDVSGTGVQQALLKLIEGTIASVHPNGGKRHSTQELIQIDTSNILFICSGTFIGLDKIVRERVEGFGIGFSAEIKSQEQQASVSEILCRVEPEDLVKYGLLPELIGRLPVIVSLDELDKEALVRVLKEPKGALVCQYKKLLKMDNVELEIQDNALRAIAHKAFEKKTGARGLRSILENALLNTMYDIPSMPNVHKVIIDESNITSNTSPLFIYKTEEAEMPEHASVLTD